MADKPQIKCEPPDKPAKLICAWCGKQIGWTCTRDGQTSHGICEVCEQLFLAQLEDDQRPR